MKKIINITFINIIILVIFLIILEFFLRYYSNIYNINFTNDNKSSNLYRVYEEGEIFETFENFYTYKKNLKKRYIYYYNNNQKLIKIWDYKFSTNNFGLVQKFDLDLYKKSILFLGDSFTEGQGAEPWIDNFGKSINGYQLVNGGFGGAGPRQFIHLNNYLSDKLNIKKRVVLFISSDIRRGISKLNNTDCIIDHMRCNKENNAYGIPATKNFNIENFLSKFVFDQKLSTKKKIKYFIRDLYIYQYLRTTINNVRLKNDKTIIKNLEALSYLNDRYKDQIIFIKIKDANDIMFKKNSYESNLIEKYFKTNGIKKYNCDMNNNISLFHNHDFHPNKKGYSVLSSCVKKILDKEL